MSLKAPAPDDVVFTGYGICSPLGDDVTGACEHLRAGKGKPFIPWQEAEALGGRCQLVGACETDVSNSSLGITPAQGRFMGRSARLALSASRRALDVAACDPSELAVIFGTGVGDCETADDIRAKLDKHGNMKKVSPASVPKLMASTASANLATILGASGPSCSVTAACSTGPYNMVMAAMLLKAGCAKIALAGGADALHISFFAGFDSMRALNGQDNARASVASRPYAADRQGFILSEGAAAVVLETRRSAEARGATVLGALRGFGMSSDGTGNMVAPAPDGGRRAMHGALQQAGVNPDAVDYINTHGTSTPVGDTSEVRAMRELFSGRAVPYSSIKGYTGHSISASGAIEAICTLEMLQGGWLSPCVNIEELDPELTDYPPVLEPTNGDFKLALSNSFGFGGTNISLLLESS